jgi:hypothetical protein
VFGIDPEVSCVSGYVQSNGKLGGTPVYKTPAEWETTNDDPNGDSTLYVRGEEMVSGKTYGARLDCDPANPGVSLSESNSDTLWVYGDSGGNGDAEMRDALLVLEGFRQRWANISFPCTDDSDCLMSIYPG